MTSLIFLDNLSVTLLWTLITEPPVPQNPSMAMSVCRQLNAIGPDFYTAYNLTKTCSLSSSSTTNKDFQPFKQGELQHPTINLTLME